MTSKSTAHKAQSQTPTLDAIKLLTEDHKEVHALFQKYQKLVDHSAKGGERQPLAEQICTMLTVHAALEEEIFYPAARKAEVGSDLLDEAEVEHDSVSALIAQIRDMQPDDALYDAKVIVLGEYVDHHVKEEQDEMFPQCRKSSMDLNALGRELAARKRALVAEMTEGLQVVH